MRSILLLFTLLAPLCVLHGAGQNVVITPKKVVYTRPKPTEDFKKTFTVRRPNAQAATPALSRKITAAISPEAVLQLNIKEELGEYQWLEEADYEIIYNQNSLLTVRLWMTGTAAYPDDVTKYVVVDTRTGTRVRPADAFQNLAGLAGMAKKAQKAEIRKSIEEMKKDPENKDADPGELFTESDFKVADLKEFSVNPRGIKFYYNYGFPHVLKALQPPGEYFFTWNQLKPFIRPDGLLARFVS
jgi:hypothetical protein